MVMVKRRDDVRADAALGKARRQCGSQSDRLKTGMYAKADPGPIACRIRANGRQPFRLAYDGEIAVAEDRVGGYRKTEALRMKLRIKRGEKPRETALST